MVTPLSTQSNPPVRRRESTGQRRREILDAALQLFLAQGIQSTTMPQICAASGASTGSVYHLFGGKDEIAMTLYVEGMQNYEEMMLRSIEKKTSLKGCIRALISTHMKHVVSDPPLSLYLARLNIADCEGELSHQYRELNNHFVDSIMSVLTPFVESGDLIRLPRELYFSIIIGPAAHLARGWLCGRIKSDLVSATDRLAEAAWLSLATTT